MSDELYLSTSEILTGLNPDILPEVDEAEFDSTAPSVIRRISNPSGDGTDFENMVLAGTFSTNDDRNDPSTLFITAYRRGPDDGEDREHFYNGYGIALMPLSKQAAADNRYNVFVVDNSLAYPRVVLENVVHTGWGDMPYIAATSTTLDPDKDYAFELRFSSNGAFKFYMAEVGAALVEIISQGAYQQQADGTYYGLSASYTEGYVWSIDSFSISYLGNKYPLHEYLLDGSEFSSSFVLKCYAYASGYNGGPGSDYGVKMFAYNYFTEAWDLIDSHSYGPGGGSFLLTSDDLSIAHYVSPSDEYIRVVVIGEHYSSYDDSVEGYLFVDEMYAENWNTAYSHAGGMGDIYLQETALPTEHEIEIYNVDQSEWLMANNSKIEGDFHLPMAWITLVQSITAMGVVIADLVEGVDYTIVVDDEYRRYSADERNKIVFAGGGGINVRITYLTFDNVEAVQSYVEIDTRRNICDDLLAFVCTPWELYVELDYRGSESRSTLRSTLSDWVMGESEATIEDHDIEAVLQALENVTNVQVETFSVVKHQKDGGSSTETADSFTLSNEDYQQYVMFNDATHITFTAESD